MHFYAQSKISSIEQIIKLVCVSESASLSISQSLSLSHETSWTLHRSQSSTDLHQTCHQGRALGDMLTCCFLCKPERRMSAKPDVKLILTTATMEK